MKLTVKRFILNQSLCPLELVESKRVVVYNIESKFAITGLRGKHPSRIVILVLALGSFVFGRHSETGIAMGAEVRIEYCIYL